MMAELSPVPFARLVARAFEELDRSGSIFGLPRRKFVLSSPLDTSVTIHGRRVPAPLGPSAGPHTQMAQNIALCWLGGARVMELKTVQSNDTITVPRPCIDARTVAYNVEWSQELSLPQSLEEYVKASMLIEMLARSGALPIDRAFAETIFDVSVGYDLAGVRSERVVSFLRAMMNARTTVNTLRSEIPSQWQRLRGIDFTTNIASSATISTFHGCPPEEIEKIAEFLMTRLGLDCAIKLNPTLLGRRTINHILHELLGFTDVEVPAATFETDLAWDPAVAMIDRLHTRARELGRGFAVKLTNTLVVENRSLFLPASEKLAYLSGAPLHVLAMQLVRRFRQTFGSELPISFSAGIDRVNYPDAVSLGLAPVTVCTDLLKQGGYARLSSYTTELAQRMNAVGAATVDEFILNARGHSELSVSEASRKNSDEYVAWLASDRRYCRDHVVKTTAWTGRTMAAFDCSTCDLCIPACPNAAVFSVPSGQSPVRTEHATRGDGTWSRTEAATIHLTRRHQIVIFADLCNDCGNCETFCPDFGSPHMLKINVFGSEEHWRSCATRDGFYVDPSSVLARIDGQEYSLTWKTDNPVRPSRHEDRQDCLSSTARFTGPRFQLLITKDAISGTGPKDIDLWPFALMQWVHTAILDTTTINFINCHALEEVPTT